MSYTEWPNLLDSSDHIFDLLSLSLSHINRDCLVLTVITLTFVHGENKHQVVHDKFPTLNL